MKVWLITLMRSHGSTLWEDSRNIKLVTVLNRRMGERQIASLIEFLYTKETCDLYQLLQNARDCPPTRLHAVKLKKGLVCGENPFLYARKVEVIDIRLENGVEKLIWKENDIIRAMKKEKTTT
ncbi:MAG: hypothetical protein ACOC0U_04070 [Desulfovibrionales bacterium]